MTFHPGEGYTAQVSGCQAETGGLRIVEASLSGLLILAGVHATYSFLAALAYRIASYWLRLLASDVPPFGVCTPRSQASTWRA